MTPIRVLVVDDHEMVAQGLDKVLSRESDIEVVGRAGTVRDAERMAREWSPDVVVMDYRLPDGDGASATAAIRDDNPKTAVVMVTASEHDTVIAAALEAGCSGYVTKTRVVEEVVSAVRAAARGEAAFPAALVSRLLAQQSGSNLRRGALTPRELEVLQLLSDGMATTDIATRLFVSVSTVRNHIQSILAKLDVHSKLEAVSVAVREGIVQSPR